MNSKLKIVFLIIVIIFMFSFCKNGEDGYTYHVLRIRNNYVENIQNFNVGSLDYGSINVGGTTEYKHLDPGSYKFSWRSLTFIFDCGELSITGAGIHLWTITVNANGNSSIAEDK